MGSILITKLKITDLRSEVIDLFEEKTLKRGRLNGRRNKS